MSPGLSPDDVSLGRPGSLGYRVIDYRRPRGGGWRWRGGHGRVVRCGSAEAGQQVTRAWAAAGILGQAAADDAAQFTGERVQAGRVIKDAGDDGRDRRCLKWVLPGRGEGKHGAEGEDIALRGKFMAVQLLGDM